MQCRTCGMTLPRGAAACPNCGTLVPGMGNSGNPGSYEPTIQATPANYPNPQIPPTSYGAPPPPPMPYGTPNPYSQQGTPGYPYQAPPPYQTPPPYQPIPGQQPGQQPPRKRRVGMIVGIVITVLVLLCVGGSVLTALLAKNASSQISHANATVRAIPTTLASTATAVDTAPTATPANTTNTQGGSGTQVTPAAALIITGVQTAKNADKASAQPIDPTKTFTVNTNVYITFTLDTTAHDFVAQPGYVEVKLYAGTQYIGNKLLQIDRAAPGGYFTGIYYIPTTAYAELYWCTQQSCSDAQLAQVATFTITK